MAGKLVYSGKDDRQWTAERLRCHASLIERKFGLAAGSLQRQVAARLELEQEARESGCPFARSLNAVEGEG